MKKFFAWILFAFTLFSISCNPTGTSENKTASNVDSSQLTPPRPCRSRPHPHNGHIRIIDYDISDQSLTLVTDGDDDAAWLVVPSGHLLKWVIDPHCPAGLHIDNIAADGNYSNEGGFFSKLPHPVGNHWEATIGNPGSANDKGYIEKYYIKWSVAGNTNTYVFDPLMQINPKTPLY